MTEQESSSAGHTERGRRSAAWKGLAHMWLHGLGTEHQVSATEIRDFTLSIVSHSKLDLNIIVQRYPLKHYKFNI